MEAWRAVVRWTSGHSSEFTKYGGLLTIASKLPQNSWAAHCITVIFFAKGDAAAFMRVCATAPSSMSIAVMAVVGKRCAIIRLMSPVPVPMSRRVGGICGEDCSFGSSAQAPSRQPSVPTFIAQRSCSIVNCLNVNPAIVFLIKMLQSYLKIPLWQNILYKRLVDD